MDNKKWYNRFATVFWWTLAILPLLYVVVTLIGTVANFNTLGGTPSDSTTISNTFNSVLVSSFANSATVFEKFSIPTLNSAFEVLFDIFGMENSSVFGIIFGYMISINAYHLIFDVLVWLPHKAHCLMEG